LALDEPKDTDNIYTVEGFTYIADKEFMEKTKPITIDFIETGFLVTAEGEAAMGCSSCGAKRSCCS